MSFFHRTRVLILTLCASGTGWAANEVVTFPPEQIDFFEKKIRPVLVESCFKCHSTTGEKVKGGLVLDTRAALLKGGDTGPAVLVAPRQPVSRNRTEGPSDLLPGVVEAAA